jgi:hypothetical protein
VEFVVVEPRDGDEIDRLITALINATGTVHQLLLDVREQTGAEGVDMIDLAADGLHDIFCVVSEQWGDEELGEVTGLLAWMTLLIADELGIREHFDPIDEPFDAA